MATSANIRLPLHVKGEHILQVIGKCVGVPFRKETFEDYKGDRPVFDPAVPGSNENPWHITFCPEGSVFELTPAKNSSLSFGQLFFTDMADQRHSWSFHQETDTDDHKLVSPVSSSLAVAVGRRLVLFFGGALQVNDNKESDPEYRKSPRSALFPPPRRRREDENPDPNERWYAFQNALNEVQPITVRELRAASKVSAHGLSERDQALLVVLEREEQRMKLARSVESIPYAPSKRSPRL